MRQPGLLQMSDHLTLLNAHAGTHRRTDWLIGGGKAVAVDKHHYSAPSNRSNKPHNG